MVNTIRILHSGSKLTNNGGVERYLMNLYQAINSDKVQFDFIIDDEGTQYYEEEIIRKGGIIYKIPMRKKFSNFLMRVQIYRKSEYEIVHVHTTHGKNLLEGILARVCGIKYVIFHSHTCKTNIPLKFKMVKWLFRIFGTHFCACSNEAGVYFFGKSILKSRKFILAKNAVSNEFVFDQFKRERIRKEWGVENQVVIGYIGRFSEEKNVPFVLEVFCELLNKGIKATLILVGGGPLEASIHEQVLKMQIYTDVLFLGVRNDIPDIMNGLDIMITPSFNEGLGLVFIEAQATGLKCYASDAVPKEAKITNLMHYISLKHTSKAWAALICQNGLYYNKTNMYESIKVNGYNLVDAAKTMESLYESLARKLEG